MSPSKIEWTDETWSPVTGCTRVSAGCDHCFARRMAKRLAGRFGYPKDEPFAVTLHPSKLDAPLRWRKPRRVFVVSMGDLFHPDVPSIFLCEVFAVMAASPTHTFQILTKRPERMRDWLTRGPDPMWPFPNVWLGVSVEDQDAAEERIPLLLDTPAAVRFVSCEPLLGPVDLDQWTVRDLSECCTEHMPWLRQPDDPGDGPPSGGLDWVIAGGESGPRARPAHPDWFRGLRDQCQAAGVAFHFKQHGASEFIPAGHWRADWADRSARDAANWHRWPDGSWTNLHFADKQTAGRRLDGRTWDEVPS